MGVTHFSAPLALTSSENVTASGAVSVSKQISRLNASAAIALTLADGTQGQLKHVVMETGSGVNTATLTPTNFVGGTNITFDAAGETVTLLFEDGNWYVVGGNAATVA
jgi:hypothetical protein